MRRGTFAFCRILSQTLGMNMKKSLAILTLILSIAGCYRPPDFDQIKSDFRHNKTSFEKLRLMITKDTQTQKSFAIGYERIGDYWEYSGEWSHSKHYEKKMTLDEVLDEVGISMNRYNEYLALFEKVGAKRISYGPKSGWTRIIIGTSGLGVSGAMTSININDDGSIPPSDIQESYQTEIIPIVDGWYINHDCT